jgi:acyl-coenzyme A thioesterase PaaI-like protein
MGRKPAPARPAPELVLASFCQEWNERALRRVPRGWEELVEEFRALQDEFAATAPPAQTVAEVSALLSSARRLLAAHAADDEEQVFGRLFELPGRGQTLIPPVTILDCGPGRLVGETTFGRFHGGANGAAHGGAIAMMFDEALGMLTFLGEQRRSRTASLTVDYRSPTPVGKTLTIEATVAEETGRKRYLHGALKDGERLCAESRGLFLTLLPGQQ